MRFGIRLSALAIGLMFASSFAEAGDAPPPSDPCNLLRPQDLNLCKPLKPRDGEQISCAGEVELSPNTLSPHVRGCELRFVPPIVNGIKATFSIVSSEAAGFTPHTVTVNFLKDGNKKSVETQIVLTAEVPSPSGLTGKEKIKINYHIDGNIAKSCGD